MARRFTFAAYSPGSGYIYVRAGGRDAVEACDRALEWLKKRGFKVSFLGGCSKVPRRAEVLDVEEDEGGRTG
ncbi:MAG: hypothetical protein QXD04_02975 [Candidatus Bathyarchaeia archaeon]